MAKKPKKRQSTLDRINERRVATQEVAALMGTRGRRRGTTAMTVAEKRAIRNSKKGNLKGLTKREKQSLYERTKRAQDERVAAAKQRRRR